MSRLWHENIKMSPVASCLGIRYETVTDKENIFPSYFAIRPDGRPMKKPHNTNWQAVASWRNSIYWSELIWEILTCWYSQFFASSAKPFDDFSLNEVGKAVRAFHGLSDTAATFLSVTDVCRVWCRLTRGDYISAPDFSMVITWTFGTEVKVKSKGDNWFRLPGCMCTKIHD